MRIVNGKEQPADKLDAVLLRGRFDAKATPECFNRKLATPKLENAFLMLDPEYAKEEGRSAEHLQMIQRGKKIRSGLGHAADGKILSSSNPKAFDLYMRFRESSSRALKARNPGKREKKIADVVAEIDAMSMETVMYSDAHMLETQIQQLSEIKQCFGGATDAEAMEYNGEVADEVVSQSCKNARILLAVSHMSSGALISRWLTRSDFKVKKVKNGEDAWNLLQKNPFDLFVCDANLEKIDGLKITEMTRKSPGAVGYLPIILMSSSKKAEEAYAAGVTDFLSKPVGKNMLLKKVGTVLENAFYKQMIRRFEQITGKNAEDSKFEYDPSKVEVMVVDDDMVTRKLVSRWLTTNKYKVVLCKTGVEAWKGIQSWSQEVKGKDDITRMILSDVTMPELSGFKLLEWVMSDKNTKHFPVILMSATTTDHSGIQRSIQTGSQDFLVKPFTKAVLLNKIKTIMETVVARRNERLLQMVRMQNRRT
uniref:Response regulatory domain-containing protein n=1 Tax=Lotharella globosa TaxID=91324 RepID=A0A7S3Z905_9EUKA